MKWLIIASIAVAPFLSHAQQFDTTTIAPRIQVSPESATPLSSVSLTLSPQESTYYDASITWYKDGAVFARGIGLVAATTTMGALGTKARITVALNDVLLETEASLIPTDVTLVWSANSYTPPFYKGRALPNTASTIYAEALPVIMRDGSPIPSKELVFKWLVNGVPRPSLSGTGRSRAVITPLLGGIRNIEVVVSSKDGDIQARTAATLPLTEMIPILYREHPLFGTLFHSALPSQIVSSETDLEFVLAPYFSQIKNARSLSYEWLVNRNPAKFDASRPDHIHLSSKGQGSAVLEVTLTNSTNLLEEAQKRWTVLLGERTASTPTL